MKHLYGSTGPSRYLLFFMAICLTISIYILYAYNIFCFSRAEQTNEYTPPEALLHASWYQGPISRTLKYVLVILIELMLN